MSPEPANWWTLPPRGGGAHLKSPALLDADHAARNPNVAKAARIPEKYPNSRNRANIQVLGIGTIFNGDVPLP
jgi:hypothetical protein